MSEMLHDIDQIFHSAIEPYEEAPSEKVWSNIENKLDQYKVKQYKRRLSLLKKLVFFLGFMVLCLGIFEVYENTESEKIDPASKEVNDSRGTSANIYPAKKPEGNKNSIVFSFRQSHDDSSARVPEKNKTTSNLSDKVKLMPSLPARRYPINNPIKRRKIENSDKLIESRPANMVLHLYGNPSLQGDKRAKGMNDQNTNKKKKDKQQLFSLWVLTGPDWSAVKLKQWSEPGLDFGLKIGYQFTPSWSIKTGMMISGKDFRTNSESFQPIDNTRDHDLDEVTGNYRVINLPLSLGYSFLNNEHSRLTVGLGVSSYWFLTEEYTYHYKRISGRTDKHWEVEAMNKNILSIINTSLDYEYYFNRKLSLSIEPFFQFPVSKIGYGRVSLQSTGIHVGAAYHF